MATIIGTRKSEHLRGTAGTDDILGNGGQDVLAGKNGKDVLSGGAANDQVRGGGGDDTMAGDAGGDVLLGGGGDDAASGGAGDDTARGGSGNDRLTGGAGDDLLSGDSGNDRVSGGADDDRISGGSGRDRLSGNDGNDNLRGGAGVDLLKGGRGDDHLSSNGGGGAMFGDGGKDVLIGWAEAEKLDGGSGADVLKGGGGKDRMFGGSGADKLVGGDGGDRMNGQSGDDRLFGNDGNDKLRGGTGDDRLKGGEGDDTLVGNENDDFLYGGAGIDTAVFFGEMAEYDFALAEGGIIVTHARGTMIDAVDFLDETIEFLRFADRTVTFGVPDPDDPDPPVSDPVASDDEGSVGEGGVLNGDGLLGNDFDAEALLGLETLSITEVNGDAGNVGVEIVLTSGALLTVNADGSYVYDPNGQFEHLGTGQTATDSFTYTVSDGNGGTDEATVEITVSGANDGPSLDAGGTVDINIFNLVSIAIAPSIDITDVDDTHMTGATVAITDGFEDGDLLLFETMHGITGAYDDETGVLTLSGSATRAQYEEALESVEYSPGLGLSLPQLLNVVLGEREITYRVSDGEATSPDEVDARAIVDVDLLII